MPFPRTWVEELIIEWLHLDGFLVEANLPVGVPEHSKGGGGRFEVDVVGARINNNTLEIRHIETGVQVPETEEKIEKKFSDKICKAVTSYFKQRFSFTGGEPDYQKIFIPTYGGSFRILEHSNIIIKPLSEFICQDILPTIQRWKQNPPHQPRCPGKHITLPESHWLLQLIDCLNSRGMLKRCQQEMPEE